MFIGAYPIGLQTLDNLSNKPILKVIAFPIFWISLSLCFYYCSSIATWTLKLPCFVSQYCLCRHHSRASLVSHWHRLTVCGTGDRGAARGHASSAPLQHLCGIRPGSDSPAAAGDQMQTRLKPDERSSYECPGRSQRGDDESTSACEEEPSLEAWGNNTSVTSAITNQGWRDGKWQ